MYWMIKAGIQNSVALLPGPISHRVYYAIQRRFGGLRSIQVEDKLRQGVEVAGHAARNGLEVAGARVLEVGTGRRLNLPLSLWLQGAREITTVDLHTYLRPELVQEDLRQIRDQRGRVEALFGPRLDRARLRKLLVLADNFNLDRLLDVCSIRYLSPADAANLALADGAIDLHVSYEVFEHIPGATLEAILREGARVLSAQGLLVHYIDFSDHFSHSDPAIGPINFLQYGDRAFGLLAGNRYMYMNRLRLDDFRGLYARAGQRVLEQVAAPDSETAGRLAQGQLKLAPAFAAKSHDVLATLNAWLVSRPEATPA
ncbi:methyltransferase domain-containing protein [Luteimonas sp. JM171]|uniref:methyltransferase domain-containing protein n=1 Tax=Luteimonas sp. JM171 TaxID=1896164 RepID=UPI00085769BD|nr:methyltransferase domain-containing protein [Luteimonas sp. JM171]AOH36642.1 hypothetical protein BGP89_09990 [Luteimonas sp. JM171]